VATRGLGGSLETPHRPRARGGAQVPDFGALAATAVDARDAVRGCRNCGTSARHCLDPACMLHRNRGFPPVPMNARHLNSSHRAALLAHFGALSRRDAYLRFGTYASPESIAAYVEGIDFGCSTVLGVYGDHLELIGVTHLCPDRGVVELGISVLASARRQGIGTLLMRRSLGHARLIGAERLFMHYLAENDDLMRLARAVGAEFSFCHDEADGFIHVPPVTAFSAAVEFAEEHVGVV
jgi:GNAT superfamily N-acetyltransferase